MILRRRITRLEKEVAELRDRLVWAEYLGELFHKEHKKAHPENYLGTGVLAGRPDDRNVAA